MWKSCPLTDLLIQNYNEFEKVTTYSIEQSGKTYWISLCNSCFLGEKGNELVKPHQHILRGLIANDKWYPVKDQAIHFKDNFKHISIFEDTSIETILRDFDYPKSIKEKLDYILELINEKQSFEGEEINICAMLGNELFKTYCKNIQEGFYYINTLVDEGFLKVKTFAAMQNFRDKVPNNIEITFKGLNYIVKLQEEGERSDKVFVAMAFRNETKGIRKAIAEACEETGFKPIIIDQEHLKSDQTINDGIIVNLKKSKFCIADFTYQREGVYFESGYVAGQNKKVIYTCKEDHFNKSHFDTNHFQHIVYNSEEQLKKDLINKIEAWIKN